jgi:hypothetical protein
MNVRMTRYLVPALLAAAIPAVAIAQAQTTPAQPEPQAKRERAERPRLSPETLNRLQDGRIAMMRESLKLDDAQLKLWAPVEEQIRARHVARRKAWQDRQQRREQPAGAERPSLAERIDRASQRMTERAQRMQAFAEAFKPFYASLSEEQKAVAGIVLRDARGGMRGAGRRWAMEYGQRGPGGPGDQPREERQPRQ